MNTTSDLSVNHNFCAIIGPYPMKQVWKYLHVCDSNRRSFIAQILKVVSSLGKKAHLKIQKNYDSETSEFRLHSFRAFQQHLADKKPKPSRGTASIFQFGAHSF